MNLATSKAIAVTFLTSFSPFVAIAQSVPDRAIPTLMKYTQCLPVSVGKQWENSPELDPEIAVSTALEDCSNEERVLYVFLSEMGLAQRDTEAFLASIKFDFRHRICVMLSDPGYLRRFKAKPHPKCVEAQNEQLSK